jgi:hypothetical protein
MAKKLTNYVGTSISTELFDQFKTLCGRYRKSHSQAITELIAAWAGRPDLMGSHKSTSPVIDRNVTKADIAIEQIRSGTAKGWRNLIEAINDLLFQNQMSITRRLIDQAMKVTKDIHGENHQITQDIKQLNDLWDARTVSLDWDISCTWQAGYPTSSGFYLIVPESGDLRLSNISDESHPDIKNDQVKMHLRIQPPCCPPYNKTTQKKDRFTCQQEPDDQPSPCQIPEEFLAEVMWGNQEELQVDPSLDQLPGSQRP